MTIGHDRFLYFAYGSNMSSRRLMHSSRAPSAKFVTVARLPERRLEFHKYSSDKSGKCDAFHTGFQGDVVLGVLFSVALSQRERLDDVEGVGKGYRVDLVRVGTQRGSFEAITYTATDIRPNLPVYDWYLEHVIRGAREFCLPSAYLARIEQVRGVPDPSAARAERELRIYR